MANREREVAKALHMLLEGVSTWDVDRDSFMAGLYMGMHFIREAPDLGPAFTSFLESVGYQSLGFATPESMELKYRNIIARVIDAARDVTLPQ